jgi:hypothetical protein
MSLLEAIRYVIAAWADVSSETIQNCWQHTRILPDSSFLDVDEGLLQEAAQDELRELETNIRRLNLPEPMIVEALLEIPDEKDIGAMPSLEENSA